MIVIMELGTRLDMKKIISFSLFGDNPLYCFGAIENAKIANKIYEGWKTRFYIANDVPEIYINELSNTNNVEIVILKKNNLFDALNWRFLPILEDDTIWISRDCDSRLSWREKEAVEEWLSTNKAAHLMRDSHNHDYPIMAGMFGINNTLFHSRYGKLNLQNNNATKRDDDQTLLQHTLWKIIKKDNICHDHWNNNTPSDEFLTYQVYDHVHYEKAYNVGMIQYLTKYRKIQLPHLFEDKQINKKFPIHKPMEYGIFVGQRIDINNKPVFNTDVRWEYELRRIKYE